MRIGIDIDGVLADFNVGYRALILEKTGIRLPQIDDTYPDCWNYDLKAGVTKEQASALWQDIKDSPVFWRNLPALPQARVALRVLADCGGLSDIYFITSRPGDRSKAQTEAWLRANGYYAYPTVLIAHASKGLLSAGLGLDVFIDDKLENCEEVRAATPACRVYIVDAPWNRSREIEGVTRVAHVLEALSGVYLRRDVPAAA